MDIAAQNTAASTSWWWQQMYRFIKTFCRLWWGPNSILRRKPEIAYVCIPGYTAHLISAHGGHTVTGDREVGIHHMHELCTYVHDRFTDYPYAEISSWLAQIQGRETLMKDKLLWQGDIFVLGAREHIGLQAGLSLFFVSCLYYFGTFRWGIY